MRNHARSDRGGRFKGSGSMPAAGARKSTKAFVPKPSAVAQVPEDESVTVVLRSGKRLVLPNPSGKKVEAGGCGDERIRLFGRAVEEAGPRWWAGDDGASGMNGGKKPAVFGKGGSVKRVGVVRRSCVEMGEGKGTQTVRYGRKYNRKRKRLSAEDAGTSSSKPGDVDDDSWRYGFVYIRKRYRKTEPSLEVALPKNRLLEGDLMVGCEGAEDTIGIAESERIFAEKFGISGRELSSGWNNHVALVALVDSASDSIHHFSRFISSVLYWTRKKSVNLLSFACFLLQKAMGRAFSGHGIHFLLVRSDHHDSFRNTQLHTGLCRIDGLLELAPLLSVNFSALPLYFKGLHIDMLLGSRYMPVYLVFGPLRVLRGGVLQDAVGINRRGSDMPELNKNKVFPSVDPLSGPDIGVAVSRNYFVNGEIAVVPNNGSNQHIEIGAKVNRNVRSMRDIRSASRSIATRRSIITRSQKRRTSSRSARKRTSLDNSSRISSDTVLSEKAKPTTQLDYLGQDSVYLDELTEAEDYAISFTSSSEMLKKPYHRLTDDRMKELKSVVTDIKQRIDSISCKANVLVIEIDRCWREEGAEVMLEAFDSSDWYLSVKLKGSTRYIHKAQETRPSVSNRHTHAMIWSGESSWKLEFVDRMDWIIFKQLHKECYERNISDASAQSIPVPGVQIVSDYENQSTFVRPDDYIKTKYTEIERILATDIPYYDMDIGDEEWLKHFNSGRIQECDDAALLSEYSFEKIIYYFEKSAYNSPDGSISQDVATSLCSDLTDKDTVAAVFDYWLKKKKNRRPLVRFFQEYPKQKMHVTQGVLLRKKRSFKRQGSNLVRGKPAFYMQAGAKQEELRPVREAEAAALRADEVAIKLRNKAQLLMSNADLLAYKSVIALRLAEAMRGSESTDVLSSIL